MGDRTWVEIVVLKESLPQVKEVLDLLDGEAHITEGDKLAAIYFDEVNYGNLEEQEKFSKHGIPYNYEWGNGDDYEAGRKYIRFTPEGEVKHIEYYDSEYNPPIEKLLELSDKPEELAQYVRQYSAEITPLPWDNQVEYGKIFRARQLLLQDN